MTSCRELLSLRQILNHDLENGKYDLLEISGGVPPGEDIEKTLKKCMDLTDGSGDRWT